MIDVIVSSPAVSSVAAVLRGKSEEDKAKEAEFDRMLARCRRKRGGHVQLPPPKTTANAKRYKMTRLYAITTIAALPRYGGTRTVVICDDFSKARRIVEENHGDIYETSYDLAVIEATIANWLYRPIHEQYWYRWYGTREKGGYQAIHVPPGYEGTCAFGVG